MAVTGDEIAAVVLKEFEALPKKRKPLDRGNGVKEWVPLAGIVVAGKDGLKCLAAATGMKCLPQTKISQAQGVTLHDWHAEILAIRSFNRFLLEECYALASGKKEASEYIRIRSKSERTESHFQPFALHDGLKLHMYCSEAPCGDASMELTMAAQEDATPWELPLPDPSTPTNPSEPILHGRSYFSHLGLVRRKPSRPDAPPTLSKSCSDKLALKQSTSLLSSLPSLLMSPSNAYLTTLTLPLSQYNSHAFTRCFSERLSALTNLHLPEPYKYTPFTPLTTTLEFPYSRRQFTSITETLMPSNISTSHTPTFTQTIINGTLQGRKQFSPLGSALVSKQRVWKLCLEIAVLLSVNKAKEIERQLRGKTYKDVKEGKFLEGRRKVKDEVRGVMGVMGGWIRNEGGEEFGIGDDDVGT